MILWGIFMPIIWLIGSIALFSIGMWPFGILFGLFSIGFILMSLGGLFVNFLETIGFLPRPASKTFSSEE